VKKRKRKKMVRDLSAERRRALNESPSDLAARDERNRQFFLSYGAPGVVTALTQYGNDIITQDSGEETKEEGKEDEIVVLEEAVDELEGCYGDNCYPAPVEWDDRPNEDLPQEPPVDPMYCRLCLKTPCVFLQYQDELERVVEIMYPEESNRTKRYHMYRRMSRELHGPLGKGRRKPLPKCFVQGFRDLYPDEADNYTGFRGDHNDEGSVII
jgi:hypothetical protein